MNITTKRTIEKCPYTSFIPEPPHRFSKATFVVISIIEKGEGNVLFNSKGDKKTTTVHVGENSCFIVPPFIATMHKNFENNVFMQRNIHVDECVFRECCNLVDPTLFDVFMNSEFPPVFKITSPASIYISEACSLISGPNDKYFESIHKSIVCSILSAYLVGNMKNNAYPVWIKILLRSLNNVDFLLLPIQNMVKTTNYSHGYVNREFKKHLGIPLKQYVLKKKLDIAASMLVASDLSMQEIIDKLHFSNASNFINIFKEHYQTTPAKYKKANSKGISFDDYQDWGVSVLDDGVNRKI